MQWYRTARAEFRHIYALRKHNMNADLHIHCLEDPNTGGDAPAHLQIGYMRGICGAAVLKGLDLIGIVAKQSLEPGQICQQVIAQHNYDLLALSGIEVKSMEGIPTIVFGATTIPQDGEEIEKICQRAHAEKGIVMVIQPSKRNMQKINDIAGEPTSPDFIEMFNDMAKSGYVHTFVDLEPAPEFELVLNSAARSPQELDRSVMVSRISRDKLIELGIVGEQQGVDYVPPYLHRIQREQKGPLTPRRVI